MPIPVSLLLAAALTTQSASPALSPTGAAPAANEVATAATQPTTRPTPDRDPWVFRCVLDNNPRMLVISLGDHWWMAFNTVDCSIYKIWNGEIELTGAVYDTKHGPQPKATGTFVIDGTDQFGRLRIGLKDSDLSRDAEGIQWLGFSIANDVVTLRWTQGGNTFGLQPTLRDGALHLKATGTGKSQPLELAAHVPMRLEYAGWENVMRDKAVYDAQRPFPSDQTLVFSLSSGALSPEILNKSATDKDQK